MLLFCYWVRTLQTNFCPMIFRFSMMMYFNAQVEELPSNEFLFEIVNDRNINKKYNKTEQNIPNLTQREHTG